MYSEIDNSEHTYIEVFGEKIAEELSSLYSYYSNTDLPLLETIIRPKLTPDRTFTVPDMPGAVHRKLVSVTKDYPGEYVRARTLFKGDEMITEYRGGHFKGYGL